jgi:hypothetical protein
VLGFTIVARKPDLVKRLGLAAPQIDLQLSLD